MAEVTSSQPKRVCRHCQALVGKKHIKRAVCHKGGQRKLRVHEIRGLKLVAYAILLRAEAERRGYYRKHNYSH